MCFNISDYKDMMGISAAVKTKKHKTLLCCLVELKWNIFLSVIIIKNDYTDFFV